MTYARILGTARPGQVLRGRLSELLRVAIQADHAGVGARQPVEQTLLRQQNRGGRVLECEREPVGRILGVERDVRTARLQDGEDRDDELQRALEAQGDERLVPDARGPQHVRELVRACVELGVCERGSVVCDRGRARRARDLLLEQLVEARHRKRRPASSRTARRAGRAPAP